MKTLISLILWHSFISSLHAGDIYENLRYGDTRDQVTAKLMKCPRVEGTIDKSLLSRVGLNGTFKLKSTLAELNFSLFFGWTDQDGLKEITLQSEPVSASQYNGKLKNAFRQAADLISRVYGKPELANEMPVSSSIEIDAILNSYLWQLDEGSLMLGIAHSTKGYHISIRYTQQRIEPKPEPEAE